MKLRPITKSSHELELSGGVRLLFSFDFVAAIESRGRVAVLALGEQKLRSTGQHIAKWLALRASEGLPALPESGATQLSRADLDAALISLLQTSYGK